jgi:GntR family histidine utilization transcriptional repressor
MASVGNADMTSPVKPRYQELKELIISRIASGKLQPLDRVPSEHELVASASVSRMTANRALRELNKEGYVNRVAGVGTFVADQKAASHDLEVWKIADQVRSRGHQHRLKILELGARPTTPNIAMALHVVTGSVHNHVALIHFENNVPIQVEERYATMDFAPDFLIQDFEAITPSAYLTSISPLEEAEHVIRAKMPSAAIQQNLQMKDNEPCLLVIRRTWVRAQPVSFARLYNPGNRFELTGHFVPPGSAEIYPKDTSITELRKIS